MEAQAERVCKRVGRSHALHVSAEVSRLELARRSARTSLCNAVLLNCHLVPNVRAPAKCRPGCRPNTFDPGNDEKRGTRLTFTGFFARISGVTPPRPRPPLIGTTVLPPCRAVKLAPRPSRPWGFLCWTIASRPFQPTQSGPMSWRGHRIYTEFTPVPELGR